MQSNKEPHENKHSNEGPLYLSAEFSDIENDSGDQ
jgi:hypothetical protein